ncbi:hypothetical protein NMY22_g871 [Coprinellus aureogranulatus]|nr:hypothetical protein NMY22_g871 [Coprinellus aureogranulatus]
MAANFRRGTAACSSPGQSADIQARLHPLQPIDARGTAYVVVLERLMVSSTVDAASFSNPPEFGNADDPPVGNDAILVMTMGTDSPESAMLYPWFAPNELRSGHRGLRAYGRRRADTMSRRTYLNADVRARDGFPPVFRWDDHPLKPPHMNRALVFLLGTTLADRKHRSQEERNLRIPAGRDEDLLRSKGYIKLQHRDILFGRSEQAPEDMWQNDVVLGWLTDERLFQPIEKQHAEEATLALLGPKQDRRPDKVAIEALGLTGVNGSRCLTFGPTTQESPQIIGPSSKLKLSAQQDGSSEVHEIVRQVLKAFTPLALRSIELGPSSLIETLKAQTDLADMPHIGSQDNWAFPSVQCNIAAAKDAETG